MSLDLSAYNKKVSNASLELDEYFINIPISNLLSFTELKKYQLVLRCEWLKKIFRSIIIERSWGFDEQIMCPPDQSVVWGHFHTEKYFKHYRNDLIKNLKLPEDLQASIKNQINFINENSNITSVHIRRGDYLLYPKIYGVCNKEYYYRAIKLIKAKYTSSKFMFFSDEMNWVKDNFVDDDFTFAKSTNSAKEDLYLMSLCTNHILSNSSFGWWGAWLNQHLTKEVITPKRWFVDDELEKLGGDIVPSDWIRI